MQDMDLAFEMSRLGSNLQCVPGHAVGRADDGRR